MFSKQDNVINKNNNKRCYHNNFFMNFRTCCWVEIKVILVIYLHALYSNLNQHKAWWDQLYELISEQIFRRIIQFYCTCFTLLLSVFYFFKLYSEPDKLKAEICGYFKLCLFNFYDTLTLAFCFIFKYIQIQVVIRFNFCFIMFVLLLTIM